MFPRLDLVETFGSIFDASESNAIKKIKEHVVALSAVPHVETILLRSDVATESFGRFDPTIAGFGSPRRLETGENLYLRVRTFVGSQQLKPEVFQPILEHETREFTFVATNPNAIRDSTTMSQVLFVHRPLSPQVPPNYANATKSPSRAVAGLNVLPLLFCDRHGVRQKVGLTIYNFTSVLCGSITTSLIGDIKGRTHNTTDVMRGFGSMAVSEWVVGARPNRRDPAAVVECSPREHLAAASKMSSTIERTLQETAAANTHGSDGLPMESVRNVREAQTTAHTFLEHGTLGGILDALACDSFAGLDMPGTTFPTRIPLYISACVLIAASPERARLPTPMDARNEDAHAGTTLLGAYYANTVGRHVATGVRSTALEAAIDVAIEDLSVLVSRDPRTAKTPSVDTIFATNSFLDAFGRVHEEVVAVPSAVEAMRRQGAALLQELFGSSPACVERGCDVELAKFMGPSFAREAKERIQNPLSASLEVIRRQRGLHGSYTPNFQRRLRRASKFAMQRTLLRLLLDLNDFCASGRYKERMFAQCNSPCDDAANGGASGISRNRQAMSAVHSQLVAYFSAGVEGLLILEIPLLFPVRARTRARCSNCAAFFPPAEVAARGLLMQCIECRSFLCDACYTSKAPAVAAARAASSLLGDAFFASKRDVFVCSRCK